MLHVSRLVQGAVHRLRCCSLPLAVVAASVCAPVLASEPWAAVYSVSVNDGAPMVIPLSVTPISNGYLYAGGGGEAGVWSTLVDVRVTFDDLLNEYSATGFLEVRNIIATARSFETHFVLSACPGFPGATRVGGLTRLQFIAGATGGTLIVQPGESAFDVLHDGQVAGAAFSAPFFITASGAGSVTVNGNFGVPVPSLAAPPLTTNLTLRKRFEINRVNTARVLLTRVASAPDDSMDAVPCGGATLECDINGDGIVNYLDLLMLLGAWGRCEGCAADFTGDDQVGFPDLTVLLSCWSMDPGQMQ